jgi:hypothetical protein
MVAHVLENYDYYLRLMHDKKLLDFIKLHTSWDLVAKQVIDLIKKFSVE